MLHAKHAFYSIQTPTLKKRRHFLSARRGWNYLLRSQLQWRFVVVSVAQIKKHYIYLGTFISFFNNHTSKVMLCECQAQIHDLVGSCPDCGRIFCSVEGSGPCQFCGSQAQHSANSKATALKNTLLDYEANSAERTKVTDLALDFNESVWDSQEIRNTKLKMRAKTTKRPERKITIDLQDMVIKADKS